MKTAILALLLLLVPASVMARPLVFAALPTESPESLVKEVRPLLNFLEKKLGLSISIEYSNDYGEILQKFKKGAIDLAFLGPLPYVSLKDAHPPAVPLVVFLDANGKVSYTCSLITANDTIKTPGQLIGKQIALTQPLSTCGYLGTEAILRKAHTSLVKNRFRYLDHHDQVALAVARGEFDAGGVMDLIAAKYRHLGLRILASSEAVPARPLVANSATMRADTIKALTAALTAYQPLKRPADRAVTASWGEAFKHGAVPVDDRDFDSIRALTRSIEVSSRGNMP